MESPGKKFLSFRQSENDLEPAAVLHIQPEKLAALQICWYLRRQEVRGRLTEQENKQWEETSSHRTKSRRLQGCSG
ncbi:hypothetical protein HMPREF9141_2234 [Prevotella multiformis DSM 16608]|uniref:Uncharacterized protein n=1 Tax=Prevotella multiformis DSM 16608 TaxID=888743 RepID=F0F9G7_9BACT|nr:hypothetical protein HMPREF9141_2234 [Prevotella multiformis DSM 16608]